MGELDVAGAAYGLEAYAGPHGEQLSTPVRLNEYVLVERFKTLSVVGVARSLVSSIRSEAVTYRTLRVDHEAISEHPVETHGTRNHERSVGFPYVLRFVRRKDRKTELAKLFRDDSSNSLLVVFVQP